MDFRSSRNKKPDDNALAKACKLVDNFTVQDIGDVPDDEAHARALQQKFDQEAEEKAERARFQCPLCLERRSFDESVQLDCLHRFCCSCFSSFLQLQITEKKVTVEELSCPMPSCSCEITVPQVEGAMRGTPLWERFLAARAELWRPSCRDGETGGERLVHCPAWPVSGGSCCTFLVAGDPEEVQCPECKLRFCPRCCMEHKGISCEDHADRLRKSDAGEQEFEEFLQNQRMQRCPTCRAPSYRDYGCNYMTCYSSRCRGKKHYCYLCGIELSPEEHFTHFPEGLFENMCRNVDKRDDELMPSASLFPKKPAAANDQNILHDLFAWLRGGQAGN